jgi:hypothetical protein
MGGYASLAEAGTFQLEFERLTHITGNPAYSRVVVFAVL